MNELNNRLILLVTIMIYYALLLILMGSCCSPVALTKEAAELIFPDSKNRIKEQIYKSFRVNPFHNYGTLRQKELIDNYIQYQAIYVPISSLNTPRIKKAFQNFDYVKLMSMFFFEKCKDILPYEYKWAFRFNLILLKTDLYFFSRPDVVYIHILLFILCNTKNTLLLKQDFINDIIVKNFFTSQDKSNINIEKLKICIRSLIKITFYLFECIVLLFCNMNYSQIKTLFASIDSTQITLVHKIVFDWMNGIIDNEVSYENLESIWENYIMSPVVYAGYSNEKNIKNYNVILQDIICERLLNLFDCDIIISSFIHMTID